MDDFVQNKLIEWGLSELEEKFEENKITKESLFCLTDENIAELIPEIGPRSIFCKRLKQLKAEQNTNQETADFPAQVLPSRSPNGKRKLDLRGDSGKRQRPTKRQRDSEKSMLSEVEAIMENVSEQLHGEGKLRNFLKEKICDLKTDKRELVGVFGKTGAGKSSLINAIIEENDLLPTGIVSACTSVMIKVQANMCSSKYEADIEFITKEDWHDELWSLKTLKKGDDDYPDMVKKLSCLYGEEWKGKSPENLLEPKYFKDIPEFLDSKRKPLRCGTAKELSLKLVKYTEGSSKREDGNKSQQWYWPLVKCVTVKVPNTPLLQHVTLVDLPGNGDCNKSRDKMWKQIVGDCSTVWIVAEITRPASEKPAWKILESDLIRNRGQCQQIHFICTKSDPSVDPSLRVTRNKAAKEEVMNKFQDMKSNDFRFKVFTVSAEEFLHGEHIKEDDNEIPKLQNFLQNLNECHSETYNYVFGAYGILSLIEGARCIKQGVETDDVCKVLEKNMNEQLDEVETAVEKAIKAFDQCLIEGVENSKTSEEKLKSFLDDGCKQTSFFSTLHSVVKKDGTHTTGKGEQIDLNKMLASCLTDSIDEKFRKTFPNHVKGGSFNGVISKFSLGTKSLIQNYKDVELQLIFLQTEEDNIKAQVNETILKQKKIIYNCLTETIKKNMKKDYEDAAEITGEGALKKMRDAIETRAYLNKKMYEEAKETLLMKMNELKATILKELKETMEYSIKLSLKTGACPLPDVSKHFQSVMQHYHKLKRRQDEETSPQ